MVELPRVLLPEEGEVGMASHGCAVDHEALRRAGGIEGGHGAGGPPANDSDDRFVHSEGGKGGGATLAKAVGVVFTCIDAHGGQSGGEPVSQLVGCERAS